MIVVNKIFFFSLEYKKMRTFISKTCSNVEGEGRRQLKKDMKEIEGALKDIDKTGMWGKMTTKKRRNCRN